MDNADLLLDHPPPPVAPPPPPPRNLHAATAHVRLPQFWADAPVAWFGTAEAQFRIRQVNTEDERFCFLTAALDKDTIKQVVHLVSDPDPAAPYSRLKEALIASHQLTDFQRVELLMAMDPLGGRKPSQMLAEMLEVCPRDEHGSKLFAALFLQRLPRELRVLLAHDDHNNLRQLAAKADQLQAYHKQQSHEVAAAVETSCTGELVAAVKGSGKAAFKKKGGKPPPLPPPRKKEGPPSPLELAQQASSLCWYHWHFGDAAKKCESPCSWQGN